MRYALILLDLKQAGPFLREHFKVIEVRVSGQVYILVPGRYPLRFGRPRKVSPKSAAKRINFERSDGKTHARAARARRSLNSWSCNGLFSPGNSLQGPIGTFQRLASVPYPTLRTSFPLPSFQAFL